MSARSSTTIARRLLGAAVLALVVASAACGARGAEQDGGAVKVAAAADLSKAFEEVGAAYEKKTGKKLKMTFGSTGLLSKQITDGAPFDVFAAANVSFADEVVQRAACDGSTKALYARGRIVLWTKDAGGPSDVAALADDRYGKVAIANPEHAPYGRAAKEALVAKGVYDTVQKKLVFGENVAQTLQYAQTGNADVAIVALSLAIGGEGHHTLIDDALHAPLDQALVVCAKGERAGAARDFAAFVNSAEGREVMKKWGFLLPGEAPPLAGK